MWCDACVCAYVFCSNAYNRYSYVVYLCHILMLYRSFNVSNIALWIKTIYFTFCLLINSGIANTNNKTIKNNKDHDLQLKPDCIYCLTLLVKCNNLLQVRVRYKYIIILYHNMFVSTLYPVQIFRYKLSALDNNN